MSSIAVKLTVFHISTQSSLKPSWLFGSPGAQWVKVVMCSSDHVKKPWTFRSFSPIHVSLVTVKDKCQKSVDLILIWLWSQTHVKSLYMQMTICFKWEWGRFLFTHCFVCFTSVFCPSANSHIQGSSGHLCFCVFFADSYINTDNFPTSSAQPWRGWTPDQLPTSCSFPVRRARFFCHWKPCSRNHQTHASLVLSTWALPIGSN